MLTPDLTRYIASMIEAARILAAERKARPKCEIATPLCSGMIVRRYQGKMAGDPIFHACIACMAYLKLGRNVVALPTMTP